MDGVSGLFWALIVDLGTTLNVSLSHLEAVLSASGCTRARAALAATKILPGASRGALRVPPALYLTTAVQRDTGLDAFLGRENELQCAFGRPGEQTVLTAIKDAPGEPRQATTPCTGHRTPSNHTQIDPSAPRLSSAGELETWCTFSTIGAWGHASILPFTSYIYSCAVDYVNYRCCPSSSYC